MTTRPNHTDRTGFAACPKDEPAGDVPTAHHPRDLRIRQSPNGSLLLETPNLGTVVVKATSAFPLTMPGRYACLKSVDGVEIACIREPAELETASRAVLEQALAGSDFVPEVHRLRKVGSAGDRTLFAAETDKGQTQFEIRADEDLRAFPPRGMLLTDVHGTKHRIGDVSQLDSASRSVL